MKPKFTPFRKHAKGIGRRGGSSFAGCPCPYCKSGLLECRTGPIDVCGKQVECTYNECPSCHGITLSESEWRRVRG